MQIQMQRTAETPSDGILDQLNAQLVEREKESSYCGERATFLIDFQRPWAALVPHATGIAVASLALMKTYEICRKKSDK